MAKQVSLTELKTQVESGWKRDQIAEYYDLPVSQVAKLLKEAGLTIRKFQKPKYVLVDDTEASLEAQQAVVQDVNDTLSGVEVQPQVSEEVLVAETAINAETSEEQPQDPGIGW